MTKKLYDIYPYQTQFTAQVLSCTSCTKGYDILLDQTLFFPEEGGQSCDKGTLNGVDVLDVQIQDGQIHHYTKEKLEGMVKGTIDFSFRYMNMQHHSGEHILSGLVHQLFGYDNIGFHLGIDEVTADYNGTFNEDQLNLLEQKVNEVILQNIEIQYGYPDNIEEISYRFKKEIKEAIRIVEIKGIDVCACCAPHVKSTIEVQVFKIIKAMKFKRGTRLYFLCGQRAIQDYQIKFKEAQKTSVLLKAHINETYNSVLRLYRENQTLKQECSKLKKEKIDQWIDSLQSTSSILAFEDNIDMATQKYCVSKLHALVDSYAALFVKNEEGYRFLLFSHDDAIQYLNVLKKHFKVKGGGNKDSIQGSICAAKEEIEEVFQNEL
ncbi:alanyl-tRNA editing protein [Floccifex sp.]|uniref:alanyl-tRNA editing protein n=1 Tax=Floccifex sp. TaxID=2815810 RepID=UPI003EFD50D8